MHVRVPDGQDVVVPEPGQDRRFAPDANRPVGQERAPASSPDKTLSWFTRRSLLGGPVKIRHFSAVVCASLLLTSAMTEAAHATPAPSGAIRDLSGCQANTLPRNDDGSTGQVALPFTANFFNHNYASLFVNNNGNVTFDAPQSTYTPYPLSTTGRVIVAPFFADVDTRNPASLETHYGNTSVDGHTAFCVDWVQVGYFNFHADKLNSFQLLLIDRSDIAPGAFDVEYNFDQVQWETGDASGGQNGLGGAPARVGFSNGVDHAYELPGSGQSGAFLDQNANTGLIHNSRSSSQAGRYVFHIRNGVDDAEARSYAYGNGGGNPASNASVACQGDPVNCGSGEYWTTNRDMNFPGRGPAVGFTRTYSSTTAATNGPFGYGWASTLGSHVERTAGSASVVQENGSNVPFTLNPDGTYSAPSWGQATLVAALDGSLTFTRRSKLVFTYDAAGVLTAVKDLANDTTTVSRDSNGHPVSVISPGGHAATLTTDPAGHVTRLVDPAGRVTAYGYDPQGNLAYVADAAGDVTKYTYDSSHLLLTKTDPTGAVVTNTYDAQARVSSQTDALGELTSFVYTGTASDPSTTTTVTDPEGRVTSNAFSGGLLTQRTLGTGPTAITTRYEVDPSSLATVGVTDALGRSTRYTYDSAGNLTTLTGPDGSMTSVTYDSLGDVTSVTDARGQRRSYTYDSLGNLLTAAVPTSAGDSVSTITRDSTHPGDVTAIRDPLGRTTSFNYDPDGLVVRVTNPLGDASTAAYDSEGNIVRQTSAAGNVATARYDALGRIVTASTGTSTNLRYAYDPNGRVASQTDAAGHTTSYTRDPLGRVVKVTRPDGTSSTSTYNSQGRTLTSTTPGGLTTRYFYGPSGLLDSVSRPQGTTSYGYDSAGQRTSAQDPLGRTTTYDYSLRGQVTKVAYGDGSAPVGYAYDATGNRTGITDGTGRSSLSFDPSGRPLSSTDGAGQTVRYVYDLAGEAITLTYPSGHAATRSFDSDGRLSRVVDWRGKSFVFGYNQDGLLTSQTDPNGVTETISRDDTETIAGQVIKRGSANVLAIDYGRDSSELLTSEKSSGMASSAPVQFGHDSLGRVTSASQTAFGYNADNLLTSIRGPGSNSLNLSYDSTSGVLSAVTSNSPGLTAAFAYDAAGDRTSETVAGTKLAYGYSQAGTLTSYNGPAGGASNTSSDKPSGSSSDSVNAAYTYDGTGLRTAKVTSGTTTRFAYDRTGSVPMILTQNDQEFVYGPRGALEQVNADGSALYLHVDQLGSTRAVTDEAGKVVQAYEYSPYGAVRIKQGGGTKTVTSLLFAGSYRDAESGLVYLQARTYDPATGQFLTVDPLVALTNQAYGYANGAPLDIVDPLGLWGWSVVGTALGVVSTVTGVVAIGLALTGVGAPVALVLEGVSVATGVAGAAVDCSQKIDVTCGLDVAAAGLGSVGAGFRVAAHFGAVAKATGETVDTVAGIYGTSVGLVGSGKSLTELLRGGEALTGHDAGSGSGGTTPVSPIYDPSGPCVI